MSSLSSRRTIARRVFVIAGLYLLMLASILTFADDELAHGFALLAASLLAFGHVLGDL